VDDLVGEDEGRKTKDEGSPSVLGPSSSVPGRYLTLFTARGRIKKSVLSEYRAAAQAGVLDFKLASGDPEVAACLADGEGEYVVVTSEGKALRFGEADVRATGRGTQGIAAVALGKGAKVIAAGAVAHRDAGTLVTLAANGIGKRVPLDDFPVKGRATGGVQATPPGVPIGAAAVAGPDSDILVRTTSGQTVRLASREIPRQGRASRGSVLLKLGADDKVTGAAVLPPEA
jgi:DNA gyrase subunit A